jgi:hypothetical protein
MRFLQLLLVASLVSIGTSIVLLISTTSVRTELLKVDVSLPAESFDRRGEARAEAAVSGPVAIAATREEASVVADDGEAEAASDDANEVASDDAERHDVTLRGRVVDAETGAPLADVSVVSEEVAVAVPTRTDADGCFEVVGTTDRMTWVSVVVARPGFVPIERDCDIDLEQGGADGLSFRLRRGCLIVGRVDLPPGIAARDVKLSVSYQDVDDGEESHADVWSVRSDGSFVIDSVVPGALVVLKSVVEERARGATLPLRIPPFAGAVVAAEIPLIARANCTIRLNPREGGRLELAGDSTPEFEDCVALRRFDRGEEFTDFHVPEEDGDYRFTDLPAGRYEARLNAHGVARDGPFVDGVPLGIFELAPGEDREIGFSRPGSLRVAGRFVPAEKVGLDHGCCPPPPASFTLERPGVRIETGLYDLRGNRFCFTSVPPGRYRLTASVDCEPLDVEAGDEGLVVREIGHGIVAGTVACAPGVWPLAVVTRTNGDASCVQCQASKPADGIWTFEFEDCGPGPLRLEIVASGHRLLSRTLRAPLATERLDVGTLQLEPEATMVGDVVDDHDRPVAGVLVLAIRALPDTGTDCNPQRAAFEEDACTTDESGRFEVPFEPRLDRFEVLLPDGERVLVDAVFERGRVLLRLPRLHAIRATLVTAQGILARDVRLILMRSTEDFRAWWRSGEASTDAGGRCTILTHATGLAELSVADCGDDVALDVEPFTLDDADLDLGTLVLRR